MATGREELLAANLTRRAQAGVNAATSGTEAQEGKSVLDSSASVSASSRNVLGANLDVLEALETVEFAPGLGDLSMRGSVAYIRFWRRGNAPQQTEVQAESAPVSAPGGPAEAAYELISADFSAIRDFELALRYGEDRENQPDNEFVYWDTDEPNVYRDEDGNIIAGVQIKEFSPQTDKQKALTATIPTTSEVENSRTSVVESRVSSVYDGPESPAPRPSAPPATGKLKSANPSGFVNSFLASNRRPATPYAGSANVIPVYSGKTKGTVGRLGSMATPTQPGMWQFLFNPSELELEAGPEYTTAETWGVSDKANSGQPLHWSHNKNARLKFNSILLNGYVFGRKVESLEQGLLELFMYRDGFGQDGPPVLEFVWGKRTFGPCVIKDINIKEKQWDEGEVVNAELSFTLEQVPEWVVNDGFVDVARPGQQPINVEQVATPSTSPDAIAASTTTGGDSIPVATEQKPQNTPAPSNQPTAADKAKIKKNCTELANIITNLKAIQSSPSFLGISQQNPAQAQQRLSKYRLSYDLAQQFKVFPLNVGANFSPSGIERQINELWNRNNARVNEQRKKSDLPPQPRNNTTYPTQQANALIASGVSYLIGNLQTQVGSAKCKDAVRSTGGNQ